MTIRVLALLSNGASEVKRVLTHIHRVLRPGDAGSSRRVQSSKEFASILNRERDRSDRTGQEFSLVVFESSASDRKSSSAKKLVATLRQRIRSTADIGSLEDGRLAAVLPHTSPDDAWKFVDTLRREFDESTPPPACTVYSYPSRWITGADGESSPAPPSGKATPSQHPIPFPGTNYSRSEAGNRARPLEELNPDFLCRIRLGKRAFDIAGSLLATVLLSPLLLMVALLIKTASPGPVFFRQERVGYRGRLFTLWKFRTMHLNADTTAHRNHLHELMNNEKEMVKLDNDKDLRIIPFGGLLRATGIDELPQLLNVLRGEMSLIGPRPCLSYEVREYASWHMRRFDTVPGLTGLWQVSGKNRTTFREMMALDIRYAKKPGFPIDLKIFLKTIPAIVRQVLDHPSYAHAQAKVSTVVRRLGAKIAAMAALGTHWK